MKIEEKVITTEDDQSKSSDDVSTSKTTEETSETTTAVSEKQTIAEALGETKENVETVSLSKYMGEKNKRRELEKKLDDLQKNINKDTTTEDVASDIAELAEEYDINPEFLGKLKKSLVDQVKRENESALKPIIEEREKNKFESTFGQKLTAALEEMPEYKNIVNPEVLKQLVLSKDSSGKLVNGHKTLEQLIEDTYSGAIGGKRIIETAKSTGKKEPAEIDFDRAKSDTAYFQEIMSNPTLKSKYNSDIEKRLNL